MAQSSATPSSDDGDTLEAFRGFPGKSAVKRMLRVEVERHAIFVARPRCNYERFAIHFSMDLK